MGKWRPYSREFKQQEVVRAAGSGEGEDQRQPSRVGAGTEDRARAGLRPEMQLIRKCNPPAFRQGRFFFASDSQHYPEVYFTLVN